MSWALSSLRTHTPTSALVGESNKALKRLPGSPLPVCRGRGVRVGDLAHHGLELWGHCLFTGGGPRELAWTGSVTEWLLPWFHVYTDTVCAHGTRPLTCGPWRSALKGNS